ncbi:class I SAM-dependent methyltransferase [Actinophytocola algeriensis]|uniref:Methyltransferase family protein n=1 Tax=Actinophytocola algeriensis TaxID=1768010 RepID=A0A7W7Q359_9PSEU|nr:class I SAM-dependent methyltransferase [Actinophytocola algeriensis]MBB4906200.1 hypothetical protein [Actinophytocola algeriensis]MBE1472115.1 hypothetical protein [Actinophytocola algeriensis]
MVRQYTREEVTGWIPESTREFSNETGFREITDWEHLNVDRASLAYFNTYAQKNFSGPLAHGMGTEQILAALDRWGGGGEWLDLGAGTSTLFWCCALEEVASITVVDASVEALVVLDRIVRSSRVPRCYRDALAMYGRDERHLARFRDAGWRYLVFDFSQTWPDAVPRSTYDLVTAFGCFGLADGPDHFHRSINETATRVAPGGTVIGANWLRTPDAIAEKGYDTTFLSTDFVADALETRGLEACEVTVVPIQGEEWYEAVVVWAGRRAV